MSAEIIAKLGLNDEKFARGLAQNESRYRAFVRRVSEIKQTKDPLPPLPEVERKANGIVAMLRRKFSGADAIKGLLGGFGLGGVGAIAGQVTNWFSRSADRAQGSQELSAGNFENMKNTMGTIGGMATRAKMARREFDDLGVQIEMTQRTLKELESNPLNLIHPLWQAQTDKVQAELNQLLGKQNAVGNEFTLLSRDLKYQNDLYENQISSVEILNRARLKGMTDLQIAEKTLLGLEIQLGTARINKRAPEELRAITLEIRRQEGAVASLVRAMENARGALAGTVTGQVIGNRRTFPNGAPRPRSETERLADRAARETQQATDAIVTGQPQLARDRLRAADRSESSVLSRVASASRLVTKDQQGNDPATIKGALTDTNTILKRIEGSLMQTKVKGGPK
jgi:hypothetical protein